MIGTAEVAKMLEALTSSGVGASSKQPSQPGEVCVRLRVVRLSGARNFVEMHRPQEPVGLVSHQDGLGEIEPWTVTEVYIIDLVPACALAITSQLTIASTAYVTRAFRPLHQPLIRASTSI